MFSFWLLWGEINILEIDFQKTLETVKANMGGYSFYDAGLSGIYF